MCSSSPGRPKAPTSPSSHLNPKGHPGRQSACHNPTRTCVAARRELGRCLHHDHPALPGLFAAEVTGQSSMPRSRPQARTAGSRGACNALLTLPGWWCGLSAAVTTTTPSSLFFQDSRMYVPCREFFFGALEKGACAFLPPPFDTRGPHRHSHANRRSSGWQRLLQPTAQVCARVWHVRRGTIAPARVACFALEISRAAVHRAAAATSTPRAASAYSARA